MQLKGEAYSKRLEEYSYNTILLISKTMNLPRELSDRSLDITTNSELSEEEVVKKLKELLASE